MYCYTYYICQGDEFVCTFIVLVSQLSPYSKIVNYLLAMFTNSHESHCNQRKYCFSIQESDQLYICVSAMYNICVSVMYMCVSYVYVCQLCICVSVMYNMCVSYV